MIELVPFTNADFDTLISWIADEEMLVQFAGSIFNFPLTHQQLEKYLQDENRFAYKVTDTISGATIGHAEIYLPGTGTTILCRIIIGNKTYRGKGLCKQIITVLLQIVFTKFGVKKAELNVFDWNVSAIKCYQQCGFVIDPAKTKERTVNGKIE